MWNVLLVEPWTPGQAPVASLYQPAPVFGGAWVSRPLPAAFAPFLRNVAIVGMQALGGVLRDEVLAHAVGGEEDGVVVGPCRRGLLAPLTAPPAPERQHEPQASSERPQQATARTRRDVDMSTSSGRRAHAASRSGVAAGRRDTAPDHTGRWTHTIPSTVTAVDVSPRGQRRRMVPCAHRSQRLAGAPATPDERRVSGRVRACIRGTPSVGRRTARPARARPAGRGDRAARAVAVRRAGRHRGKTTTLVARVAWLIDGGTAAGRRSAAITFNKRAAEELTERLDAALGAARRGAGRGPRPDVPRARARDPARRRRRRRAARRPARRSCATVAPWADEADRCRLDTRRLAAQAGPRRHGRRRRRRPRGRARSRARSSPTSGPSRRPAGSTSTTSSSARSRALEARRRRCSRAGAAGARDLLVDEVAGPRPAAAPARPAARRAGEPDLPRRRRRPVDLRLAAGRRPADPGPRRRSLPGLRRVDLEVNYRCPRPVVERAVRLVEHNRERFAKAIRAGPAATGRLVLAPDAVGRDRSASSARSGPGRTTASTRAVLARTNRELLPAVVVALELGLPFRAPRIDLLARVAARRRAARSGGRRRRRRPATTAAAGARSGGSARPRSPTTRATAAVAAALLGWAVGRTPTCAAFAAAIARRRAAARRPPPRRRAADARDRPRDQGPRVRPRHRPRHGGRPLPERAGRQPGRRSRRAHEEERRLGYVAWTRARRR